MNELVDYAKNNLIEYDSENDFLKSNNIDKDDFDAWKIQGCSDDGFIQVMDCYWLAGDITRGNFLKITTYKEITDLIWAEIKESDFYDTIELLNDGMGQNDPRYVDPNDDLQVLETFFEYCESGAGKIAIFKNEGGKYKGGYCLVIVTD